MRHAATLNQSKRCVQATLAVGHKAGASLNTAWTERAMRVGIAYPRATPPDHPRMPAADTRHADSAPGDLRRSISNTLKGSAGNLQDLVKVVSTTFDDDFDASHIV